MLRFYVTLMLCAALCACLGNPVFARGGFTGGHSMGGHFAGSSHMSMGHFGGYSHMSMGSHFSGTGHMSMGSFFGGHSMHRLGSSGHTSGLHFSTNDSHPGFMKSTHTRTLTPGETHHLMETDSLHSPLQSGMQSLPTVHHGFVHGLARLFGFASPSRVTVQRPMPPMDLGEHAIASNFSHSPTTNIAALRSFPITAYLSPCVRRCNPYLGYRFSRNYPRLSLWYPYLGSYWGSAFPYNFYSPWFLPDYYPLLLFGYLDPEYYFSFCPSMYFPYTSAFAESSPIDPYFVAGDTISENNYPGVQAYNPGNSALSPPSYDSSSGIVDPELVPFDLSVPAK